MRDVVLNLTVPPEWAQAGEKLLAAQRYMEEARRLAEGAIEILVGFSQGTDLLVGAVEHSLGASETLPANYDPLPTMRTG
jgi:hypothetical protein